MHQQLPAEGMKTARLFMVMSSFSPLFILWAIRGNGLIPEHCFIGFCAFMVILPNLVLWLRYCAACKEKDTGVINVGRVEDHRDHLLVYLFAMLLPFYTADLTSLRELLAALAALGFVVYLFWHLNLHYMNIIFAIKGYRVFTIYPPVTDNPIAGKQSQVLITRRVVILPGEHIIAYSLSDNVYFEGDICHHSHSTLTE